MIQPNQPLNLHASDGGARRRGSRRPGPCILGLALAVLLAGRAAGTTAQEGADPLQSPECASAQLALERTLQEAAAGNAAARGNIAATRDRVREACLGRQAGQPQRSGAPSSPVAVPAAPSLEPQGGGAPPAMGAPPAPPSAPPRAPVQIPRPVAITTCDPGGCWDSTGRRLNFMGPVLIGPQGSVCTVQAGMVHCPQ